MSNFRRRLLMYNQMRPWWFKNSLVCWYDVEKQGCTNENMKAMTTPVLKDFSGNGHDLTLHNFNWERESGVGNNYAVNLDEITITEGHSIKREGNKLTVTNILNGAYLWYKKSSDKTGFPKETRIRITGLDSNTKGSIWFGYSDIDGNAQMIKFYEDGEYILPKSYPGSRAWGIASFSYTGPCNFSVEYLEDDFSNALLFDGLDDYGISEGQPILNDYTWIANRQVLDDGNRPETFIFNKVNKAYSDGAFVSDGKHTTWSYGTSTEVSLVKGGIVYQSKNSYNGLPIKSGTINDGDKLLFGSYSERLAKANFALYQFLLFNRTLTQEEIDWVKVNIMHDYPSYAAGIAFHLDCNNGYNGTTWTELISGKQFTMNGTTKGADGGIVFNGNAWGEISENIAFDLHTSTIEVTYKEDANYLQLIYVPPSNNSIAFGFGADSIVWCTRPNKGNVQSVYKYTHTKDFTSVSANIDTCYINDKESPKYFNDFWIFEGNKTCIGARYNPNLVNNFKGEIYAIRIYNRILTKEEILHNQKVDFLKYKGSPL